MGVINLLRTHEGRGWGSSKGVRHAHKGEEVDIFKYVRKKSLFGCILLYFHMDCTFIVLFCL